VARIRSPKCAPFRKIELEAFTRQQAMNIARFQANVAGKARPRQMDADTDLRGNASRDWTPICNRKSHISALGMTTKRENRDSPGMTEAVSGRSSLCPSDSAIKNPTI